MRHAKSAWDTDAGDDHERPLNARGRRDAPRVAERLRELGWSPERVISSDALRTRQTWELMEPVLAPPAVPVTFTRELYLAGVSAVRSVLAPLADTVRTAMVLGHNPGWEDVVAWLTGKLEPLGTADAALVRVDADSWADAVQRAGRWQLHDVIRSKAI